MTPKLLRHGGDWLTTHPERERIVDRYLKHQRFLTRQALARLLGQKRAELTIEHSPGGLLSSDFTYTRIKTVDFHVSPVHPHACGEHSR